MPLLHRLGYFFLPDAETDDTAGFFWLLAFFALCCACCFCLFFGFESPIDGDCSALRPIGYTSLKKSEKANSPIFRSSSPGSFSPPRLRALRVKPPQKERWFPKPRLFSLGVCPPCPHPPPPLAPKAGTRRLRSSSSKWKKAAASHPTPSAITARPSSNSRPPSRTNRGGT